MILVKDHGDVKDQCLGYWPQQLGLPGRPVRQALEVGGAVKGLLSPNLAGGDAALVDGPSRYQRCQSRVLTTLWRQKDPS